MKPEANQPNPSTAPVERYRRVMYVILGTTARICGLAVTLPNFRVNALTVLCTGICVSDLFLCAYTMIGFSTEVAIKSFTNFAFTIQFLSKVFCYLKGRSQIREFSMYLLKLYNANNSLSDPFHDVLDKCCRMFERLVIIGMFLYMLVAISFLANTVLLFVFTGQMVPIFEIYIPGVDITTPHGFVISSALHAVNGVYACFGSVAADFVFILICGHLWPMCIIFERYVTSLDDDLLADGMERRWTIRKELKLRNILLVHQEMVEFSQTVFSHYYVFTSLELYNNQYLMIVLLYCMLTMNWPPGVLFLFLLTVRLLVYCILGTIIDSMNTRIYRALLGSQWYRMPVHCRYRIGMMILRAQRATTLSAGLVPLNLDTFVNVMHTIYSVTMLLMQTM